MRNYELHFYKNPVPHASLGQLFVGFALEVVILFILVTPSSTPRNLTGMRSISCSHRTIFLLFRNPECRLGFISTTIEYFINPILGQLLCLWCNGVGIVERYMNSKLLTNKKAWRPILWNWVLNTCNFYLIKQRSWVKLLPIREK